MKSHGTSRDWCVALTLTAVLHLLIVVTAALPPDNYFFPFFQGLDDHVGGLNHSEITDSQIAEPEPAPSHQAQQRQTYGEDVPTTPYLHGARLKPAVAGQTQEAGVAQPLFTGFGLPGSEGYRSLVRTSPVARLLAPQFSASSIPPKPAKAMWQEVEESAESYLLGDVMQDAMPATETKAQLAHREAAFMAQVKEDINDGRLDMAFSSFIITAEYFQLSRALIEQGLQPAFTLGEAMDRYRQRLAKVAVGLPPELDGYWLVMILQRYAENKFYPGNGSGMVLDSLFHNLNDCEGGTKELLAYLGDLYPALLLGSNRGMLLTTTGEMIAHMQVYLGPGPVSEKILPGHQGLVVETTRVSRGSILPYSAGDVFPLEDFVVRYYPDLVADTPLAGMLGGSEEPAGGETREIVGTSDHPLKMSYGASSSLLTSQFYDLANIRTQRLANEFLKSNIPSCNPKIEPTRIDRTNLFSNFIAIDGKLRQSLIGHYLADLQYWDNEIMPQWQEPEFLATYDDLAGSLTDQDKAGAGYLQISPDHSLPMKSVESHGQFVKYLRDKSSPVKDQYIGAGRQECEGRAVLDDRLLEFLFAATDKPGVFFLQAPAEGFSWTIFQDNILQDCLAVPAAEGERTLVGPLEVEAGRHHTSLRKELYKRAESRGLATSGAGNRLAETEAALAAILAGEGSGKAIKGRQSAESTKEEPSVLETVDLLGATGINSGLLWDIFDFLGSDKIRSGLIDYATRGDLRLSVRRAHTLVAETLTILGGQDRASGETTALLENLTSEKVNSTVRLAAALALARIQNASAAEVSRIALDYLRREKNYRAETLLALLELGLQKNDARLVLRERVVAAVDRIPELGGRTTPGGGGTETFIELVELIWTLQYLPDEQARTALLAGLHRSLARDFAGKKGDNARASATPDYGVLFNKLASLVLLREVTRHDGWTAKEAGTWLTSFIHFAGNTPIGMLMIPLVEKIHAGDSLQTTLGESVASQFAALARLQGELARKGLNDGGARYDELWRQVVAMLGDANVIARMLLSADAGLVSRISGLPPASFVGKEKAKAAWYLERLHRNIGALGPSGSRSGGPQPMNGQVPAIGYDGHFPVAFYLDDRVRESFVLLGYFQEGGKEGMGLRFRKTQDLGKIKDPTKLIIIEAERTISRQDMSLLTLALHPGNSPKSIRTTLDQTLAVTGKHLTLPSLDKRQKEYLFAPHYPYLVENDLGFTFSPEMVEDLHNAEQWGGRNDILLSSYLHFKNMPSRLPDWLLRTAKARSQLELDIINKFTEQSFLPMILECDNDHQNMPDPLFRAKWTIRKPFGEDIFPGTLLLLRLGYLEITPLGDIVQTAKYAGA